MCVEGGFFFKINKRDSTFIREMRVNSIYVVLNVLTFQASLLSCPKFWPTQLP